MNVCCGDGYEHVNKMMMCVHRHAYLHYHAGALARVNSMFWY